MKLYPVTVTLTDVSGVVISRTKAGTFTDFNFTAGGRREYAVQMHGTVRVESGMIVTAVLRAPNNWQTLEGWLNHENGCIEGVLPIPKLRFAAVLFGALYAAILFLSCFLWFGDPKNHAFTISFNVVFGLAALLPIANWGRGTQVWNELAAIRKRSGIS